MDIETALKAAETALLSVSDQFPRAYSYLYQVQAWFVLVENAKDDQVCHDYRNKGAFAKDMFSLYFKGRDEGDPECLLDSALLGFSEAADLLARNLEIIQRDPKAERHGYLRPAEIENWYLGKKALIEELKLRFGAK